MKFCPHCGGSLAQYMVGAPAPAAISPSATPPYNQTAIWKGIQEQIRAIQATPPGLEVLVLPAIDWINTAFAAQPGPLKTVVHLGFDRDVVPQGGALHHITMTMGRSSFDEARLEGMGYAMVDGKVVTVDEVPVGPAYQLLDYWAGARQYKRWHLEAPCEINPSRTGDPLFMDANMIAFGATWKDAGRVQEALFELLGMFANGFGTHQQRIAAPLVLQIVKR